MRKLAALEPAAAWPGHAKPVTGDVRAQLERAAETDDAAERGQARAPAESGCAPRAATTPTPTATCSRCAAR